MFSIIVIALIEIIIAIAMGTIVNLFCYGRLLTIPIPI